MVALTWLRGLLRRRPGRLLAVAAGGALAVAFIASIGSFLSATTSKMTERAVARVPVDWQVEGQGAIGPAALLAQLRTDPGVVKALPVLYADSPGFTARTGGSTQSTGAGKVLGIPPGYAHAFPGEIRTLSGSGQGVLLAQQTAANLHAAPGDTITIRAGGGRSRPVRVDGVVDLPEIDSLFQHVGAPPGSQATAPPDNVVLLPSSLFNRVEAGARVTPQVHANLTRKLPSSPSSAFSAVEGHARNLETRLAGNGLVGDNLGAALDKARQDALYAQLLFLFLGVPGAVLAGLVTASIASSGADRRRREAALLRTRGASTRQLVRVALGESVSAGALGVVVGLGAALLVGSAAFGTAAFGASTLTAVLWALGASLAGLAIAALAIVLPAWRDARALTVAGQRREVGRRARAPWWVRYGVDFIALAAAGLVYWQASRNGYQLVLAPEGVPQVQVNWFALLAPALGWLGAGLFAYRLADLVLARGRRPLTRLFRPAAAELAPTVVSTMSRQRRLLARTVALLALTAGFAASTAVFNSTYKQQAEVDARLTNGADVTVTSAPGTNLPPGTPGAIARTPGVKSVEPMMHRFAYVGPDLQDLYGVRPSTIGRAGELQNAWFQGGGAGELMKKLGSRPDGVLVAAETVHDFQLRPGDLIRLRLEDARTRRYTTVPFHYIGVAKEFPTAPTDSFLVANASYVARQTGSNAVSTFLVQTDGTSPATVASRLKPRVGARAQISDIVTSRRVVGSNLTAVELSGLTKVELGFALVLAIAASGLPLALGFRERRRTFALASALGARTRQLGGFVWSECAFVTLGGLAIGTAIAVAVSVMLVKVLTGVFDPPPDNLSVPWGYLLGLLALTLAAVAAAGVLTVRALREPSIEELRDF